MSDTRVAADIAGLVDGLDPDAHALFRAVSGQIEAALRRGDRDALRRLAASIPTLDSIGRRLREYLAALATVDARPFRGGDVMPDTNDRPAGRAVPPSPQFARLTAAGCPPSTAQQLTGAGLTDAQVGGIAARAELSRGGGSFDWAGLARATRDLGPSYADRFTGAGHVPTPAVALAVPPASGPGAGPQPDVPAAGAEAPRVETAAPALSRGPP